MNDHEAVATRGHRRSRHWRSVAHGIHCRTSATDEFAAELAAWQLLLTRDGSFTGLTSAQVRDWWLPPLPAAVPVFVALRHDDPRPMREGVVASRHRRLIPHEESRGMRCAVPAETLLACARVVGLLDLVVLADCALHRAEVGVDELLAVARPRRPGARALRRALELTDPRPESPWEVVQHVFHQVMGVETEPQHVLVHQGSEIARTDLWLVGTKSHHEYDGAVHLPPAQQVKDLQRARRIDEAGQVRRGYTSGDLLHRPVGVLRDIDRAVGRQHDPARVRVWTEMLRTSLFTESGRAAFSARWRRPITPAA